MGKVRVQVCGTGKFTGWLILRCNMGVVRDRLVAWVGLQEGNMRCNMVRLRDRLVWVILRVGQY